MMKRILLVKLLLISIYMSGCGALIRNHRVPLVKHVVRGEYNVIMEKNISDSAFIHGYIYDKLTDEPLHYALVTLQPVNTSIFSDSVGYYHVPVNEGMYIITVTHVGNDKISTENIRARLGAATRVDFRMGTTQIK